MVIGPLNGGMEYPPAFRSIESSFSRFAVAVGRSFSNTVNALLLGKRDVAWSFDHYVTEADDRDNPEVSPLRAPDLSNLPPAIVITDEYDPLRDEGFAYTARLRDAGVPVTARHYDDMMHVFFQFVNIFERGNEAVEQVGRDIQTALSPTPASVSATHGGT